MQSGDEKHNAWLLTIGIIVSVLALTAGPALAALTFSGTSIQGDGAVVIDSSSTISIGTSTATGITIGNGSSTATFRGNAILTKELDLGSNAAPSGLTPTDLIYVNNTLTQKSTGGDPASGRVLFVDQNLDWSDSDPTTGSNNILDMSMTIPAGVVGSVAFADPVYAGFFHNGSGTASHVQTYYSDIESGPGSTQGDTTAYYAGFYNANVTGIYRGLWWQSFGNDGTVAAFYGVDIEDPPGTINGRVAAFNSQINAGANRWAFYGAGTAASSFGGAIGIETTAPSTTFQVAGASSTIRIGTASLPGCLEMGNSNGSAGINYVTVLNGVMTATTTKPSACQ